MNLEYLDPAYLLGLVIKTHHCYLVIEFLIEGLNILVYILKRIPRPEKQRQNVKFFQSSILRMQKAIPVFSKLGSKTSKLNWIPRLEKQIEAEWKIGEVVKITNAKGHSRFLQTRLQNLQRVFGMDGSRP
ncbi:hypothetical protein L1887_05073 [Cichorium endivia]|nr:hypothetical protein L1887_05073 [Cichorium endivia]